MNDLVPAAFYRLPPALRGELAEPWGPVVAGSDLTRLVSPTDLLICVGDVVSLTALDLGLRPRLIIVDGRTQRGPLSEASQALLSKYGAPVLVRNPAATLTRSAWLAVRGAIRSRMPKPTRLVVDGEEDLVGIACFLEAPDGAVVLYGMPGRGVAFVRVDEAVRDKVRDLVAHFEAAR